MSKLHFTSHALARMFERRISPRDCESVLLSGVVVEKYPDDEPFPSELHLGFVNGRPIHLVVSFDDETAHIITAYEPVKELWEEGFRMRRRKKDD